MSIRALEVMGRSTGGVGRHVAALAAGLDGDEVAVEIAAPPATMIPMPKPVLALEIPKRPGVAALKALGDLREIIEEGGFQVLHGHGLRASLVTLRAAGPLPVVATLHNLVHPETSGRMGDVLFRRGEGAVLRGARHVFAVSEEMVEELASRAPADAHKVELLRIGLPAPLVVRSREQVRSELGVDGKPLVVTVARLAPQKALDVLIDAVARLEDVALAIVGNGQLEDELRARARSLGIAERVHFVGWTPQVGDYLGAADLFALSSTWEARALAVQEAILADVPVVATDVGGLPELVTDRDSGRLVPPNDAAALAEAMRETLAAPDEARLYAQRARERLAASYSDAEMLATVRRVYLELAGG
jgi:glycosyltransferase involved in cell wall biosynthesis